MQFKLYQMIARVTTLKFIRTKQRWIHTLHENVQVFIKIHSKFVDFFFTKKNIHQTQFILTLPLLCVHCIINRRNLNYNAS